MHRCKRIEDDPGTKSTAEFHTHTHNGRPTLRQATLRQVCGAKSRKWMEVDERDLGECIHPQQVTWWSWRPLRSGMFFRVLVAPPPVMIAEQAERCL